MKFIVDTLLYPTFHLTPFYMALKNLFQHYLVSKGKFLELPFSGKSQDLLFLCSALELKQLLKCWKFPLWGNCGCTDTTKRHSFKLDYCPLRLSKMTIAG